MPDIVVTFTIPDAKVAKVAEAYNATHEKEPGENDKQLFMRVVKGDIVATVAKYFQRKAKSLTVTDEDVVEVT
jgi:hypothetical protein